MLRRVSIENFKAVGKRVDIEVKPVTLLFGPNSVGKSSILHAFHYVHALLESGDPEVGRTRLGGEVDLGGFRAFVHRHDLARPVYMAFSFTPDLAGPLLTVLGGPSPGSVDIHLEIRWSPYLERPLVTRYGIALDDEPFVAYGCGIDGANVSLLEHVESHPSLEGDGFLGYFEPTEGDFSSRSGALPRLDYEVARIDYIGESHFIRAAAKELKEQLERFRYVGPIRHSPPRTYVPPKRADEARWAKGLGAWDSLVTNPDLCETANEWLIGVDRLDTGYRLCWKGYRELDDDTLAQMVSAAANGRLDEQLEALVHDLEPGGRLVVEVERKEIELSPCDLGEGIAQVVPVVVAALAETLITPSGSEEVVELVAIEQPELHIHPRMQTVLGDLFLSQCADRQFLVETHSEHLMLRLLRRIRETTDNELPPDAPSATTDTVAVLYVERGDDGVRISNLRISEDGDFLDRWPDGFFPERLEELL